MLFSSLFQILQLALLGIGKRRPQSSSKQTSIGPLQALTLESFIPFLSWHVPSCVLQAGTYAAMEIILEVTQALLVPLPTPRETKEEKRQEACGSMAFG